MTILQNSILYLGYARDKEEASDAIFRHMNVKGIIGVLKSDEIIWGGETIQKYWEQYSNTAVLFLTSNMFARTLIVNSALSCIQCKKRCIARNGGLYSCPLMTENF